jgi:hypothetical protein
MRLALTLLLLTFNELKTKLILKTGKPKRRMGLKMHPRWFETSCLSRVAERGSLCEIEASVDSVV